MAHNPCFSGLQREGESSCGYKFMLQAEKSGSWPKAARDLYVRFVKWPLCCVLHPVPTGIFVVMLLISARCWGNSDFIFFYTLAGHNNSAMLWIS